MPADNPPSHAEERRSVLSRLIDNYNPGITLLVLVWVIGLSAKRYVMQRGDMTGFQDRALTSLIYVVPIMLVGWAVLAIADRYLELGFFPREDD